jgi:hypothetical protein
MPEIKVVSIKYDVLLSSNPDNLGGGDWGVNGDEVM